MTVARRVTDRRISPFFSVRGVQGGAAAHHEEGVSRSAIAAVQYVEAALSCPNLHLIADVLAPRRRPAVRKLQEGTAFLPALLSYAEANDLCRIQSPQNPFNQAHMARACFPAWFLPPLRFFH